VGPKSDDRPVERETGITEFDEGSQDPITAELRKLYNDALAEPLPDHLLRLLDKLAEAEGKR
jgi:hypothetical protein